jgi:hypothetical protein
VVGAGREEGGVSGKEQYLACAKVCFAAAPLLSGVRKTRTELAGWWCLLMWGLELH